jgi:chitin-binding protein
MFIPSTLKATTSFTHIAQMKVPNAKPEDEASIYVMSLRRHGDNETIEAKITTNDEMLGSTNLKPLHDKWIDVELEYYVDDLHGSAKWTIISDNKTVVHVEKENAKTFFHETVRPKWGIYRSLSDSKQLLDTYLLITKMRAYKFE